MPSAEHSQQPDRRPDGAGPEDTPQKATLLVAIPGVAAFTALIGRGSDIDLSQAADRLALQQASAVDPQQFAERLGVASIRLLLLSFFRLDEDHFLATVIVEHADQPIVETTDFEDGDERFIVLQPLAGQPLKELVNLLRLRRHLPSHQDITVFVAERNRDLTSMLVDTKE